MLLEVDMGNSRLKWRLKRDGFIVDKGYFVIAHDFESQVKIPLAGVKCVAISSVNSQRNLQWLIEYLKRHNCDIDIFKAKTESKFLGVACGYVEPCCLGVDRWLAVIGAYELCGASCCVVDMGTAITVDWVDSAGNHLGGLIVPGDAFMQNSLFKGTEQVRFLSEVRKNFGGVGKTTEECVSAGAGLMTRAFIAYIVNDHPLSKGSKFYFTGGGGQSVISFLPSSVEYIADLVLDGLSLVSHNYFIGKIK